MKSKLTIGAIGAALSLIGCKKENATLPTKPVLVNKTISFTIKATEAYSGAAYNNAFVEIKLGVFKTKPGGQTEALLDTTLGIKSFRSADFQGQGIKVSKLIKGIDNEKETVSYSFLRSTTIDGFHSVNAGNIFLLSTEFDKNVIVTF